MLSHLQGYSAIQSEVGLSNLRCIRGDQYCGVRATTFQALSTGHPFPRCCTTLARLVAEVTSEGSWIKKWTFANRIHYENVLDGIVDCLDALDNVVSMAWAVVRIMTAITIQIYIKFNQYFSDFNDTKCITFNIISSQSFLHR